MTADSPVILVLLATVQVYFMPAGTMSLPPVAGVTVNVSPEQIAAVLFPITTVTGGSTITVSMKGVPVQDPLLGVTE